MDKSSIYLCLVIFCCLAAQTGARSPIREKLHCGVGAKVTSENSTRFLIVGGEDASPGEFPSNVVFDVMRNEGRYRCGGTIIDSRHILTTAFCIYSRSDSKEHLKRISVGVGEHSIDTVGDGEIVLGVSGYVIHENFSPDKHFLFEDNIALVETIKPMRFRVRKRGLGSVNRVCLPDSGQEEFKAGDNVTISGWGKTSGTKKDSDSDIIQKARLQITDFETCKKAWKDLIGWDLDESKVVCANSPRGDMSSCLNDNGGPLLKVDQYGYQTIIGITSFGISKDGCKNDVYPSVYTRVSAYLDWIEVAKKKLSHAKRHNYILV